MNITKLYKDKIDHLKEMTFMDSKIMVKLFLHDEAVEFSEMVLDSKRWDEFLSKSIFEDDMSIFDGGKINVFKNMPNEHKKQLMEVITVANGGNASFEEKKSD